MKKLKPFLLESYKELKRVNWPTRQETTHLTLVVVGMSLGVAAFLGVLDYFFILLLRAVI